MKPQNLPRLSISIEEAMEATGWDRRRIYTLIQTDALRTYKTGRRRFTTPAWIQDCINRLADATDKGETLK